MLGSLTYRRCDPINGPYDHFFYSELMDILVESGHIRIPAAGVATYIVDWSED